MTTTGLFQSELSAHLAGPAPCRGLGRCPIRLPGRAIAATPTARAVARLDAVFPELSKQQVIGG